MFILWKILLLSFLLAFIDGAAGMGFGTTISPLLFLLGYSPLEVVPSLLISQSITGLTAGIFHEGFGNVNFSICPLSPATKIMLLIAGVGSVGSICSIFLAYYSIRLQASIIKVYVSFLLILMGMLNLMKLKAREKYRPKVLTGFALLAGFNKGIGGGGYGPVVTIGQVLSGVYEKSAVGITSLAEGNISLIGSLAFLFLQVISPVSISLTLLPSLFSGAFFASIFSPYAVRVLPNKVWRFFIPLYAFAIGIWSLTTFLL